MNFKTALRASTIAGLAGLLAACSGNVNNSTGNIMLTLRVSVSTGLIEADNPSSQPSISGNGLYVAFQSSAPNLSPPGINSSGDYQHIFVADLPKRKITMVTLDAAGNLEANGDSANPVISSDGKYVAFQSYATNLVSNTTPSGAHENIYLFSVKDTTTRLLVSTTFVDNDQEADDGSTVPSLSGNGEEISFDSLATDLTSTATTATRSHVYFRTTLPLGTTVLVSKDSGGAEGDSPSEQCTLSTDGTKIAFQSKSINLHGFVGDPQAGVPQLYLADLSGTGTPILITKNVQASSPTALGNGISQDPSISRDGSFVAFSSAADNLSQLFDGNNRFDIYLYKSDGGTSIRISKRPNSAESSSRDCNNPSIGGNATAIAFHSKSANLVDGDTNELVDIFFYTIPDDELRRVSLTTYGEQGTSILGGANSGSMFPSLSANGSYVAYESNVSNLVEDDGNDVRDIFVTGPLYAE